MKFIETELPGVIIIEPDIYRDERGFFFETYHAKKYRSGGITETFVQDNHSRSTYGTLRGLHAQTAHPQGKLVRVIEGEIFDVAVDIRRGSATFGRWLGATLSADNGWQYYIPPGFAHGFCVTSEFAQVEYKCTDFYDPAGEIILSWCDPDLAITWPIESPILSAKDAAARTLREIESLLPVCEEAA
jgi:dTDP-4-dehydrorhamnose 3,5-epimerase